MDFTHLLMLKSKEFNTWSALWMMATSISSAILWPNSRGTSSLRKSAISAATSTPVGPPPHTTTRSSCLRCSRDVDGRQAVQNVMGVRGTGGNSCDMPQTSFKISKDALAKGYAVADFFHEQAVFADPRRTEPDKAITRGNRQPAQLNH